jgi:hypothetical protein
VQLTDTHAVTLFWNVGLVQMHFWSIGAQALVVKAFNKHVCYDRSVQEVKMKLRHLQHKQEVSRGNWKEMLAAVPRQPSKDQTTTRKASFGKEMSW